MRAPDNGKDKDDPGANGTISARAWSVSDGSSTTAGWRYGYYGHSSYHGAGNFDGTEYYLQVRVKMDPNRAASNNPTGGKLFYFTRTDRSLTSPVFGLYVYVATFYLHPPSRWWGNDLPDLRWSLLAGLVTLAATLRLPADSERPSWITTTPAKLLIAYTVWVWVQNAWALDPSSHLDLSILFTKYVILYYLVYRLVNTPRQFTLFLLAHLAGCFYLAWLAFNARFTGRLEGVGGPGIDEANALGMTMATAAAVGAALMLRFRFRDWRCWIPILVMPWVLNALVLTGSRSSLLGLIAGGLTIWYLKPKGYGLKFYGFAALGLVLIGMLAHDQFLSRMRTITVAIDAPEELDVSAESRIELLKVQAEIVWDREYRGQLGLSIQDTARAGR